MRVDELKGAPRIRLSSDGFFPGRLGRLQFLLGADQVVLSLLQTPGQMCLAVGQIGLGHLDRGPQAVVARVGAVVKEGVEAVVFLVGDGIVFVRVALGAVQGQSEPCGADGRHPVLHRLGAVFLGIAPALVIDLGVAVETRGDALGQSGLRQEIAGQLINGELVEWLIAIESIDHPLAVRPNGPSQVYLIAVGIGVPRQIKPASGHVFPVVRRRQQTVDEVLVGPGRGVCNKGLNLGRFRRQTGEVERYAPCQIRTICFWLRL